MYTAQCSFLSAICGAAQKDSFIVYAQENGAAVASIVLLGSTVALAYNAVHNMLLKRTSSVAVRFSIFLAIGEIVLNSSVFHALCREPLAVEVSGPARES